jgi:hypothetical protein
MKSWVVDARTFAEIVPIVGATRLLYADPNVFHLQGLITLKIKL